VQTPTQDVLDPAVAALLALNMGFDLGIVGMNIMVTHDRPSRLLEYNYFTGKTKKKIE
jgi:hypothetical protein